MADNPGNSTATDGDSQPEHTLSDESGPNAESEAPTMQTTQRLERENYTAAQRLEHAIMMVRFMRSQGQLPREREPSKPAAQPSQETDILNDTSLATSHFWVFRRHEVSSPTTLSSPAPARPSSARPLSTATSRPSSSVSEDLPSEDAVTSIAKNIPGPRLKK
ncbi:hypothetical protein QBC32DRAFT_318276 [Pseudoneurospora amorphoporcata]|uniref:Uncharacterized protein n=1 Tax=Pseudoneurospora amorphoporcata TaxID=241081 RepID=A0AAN6SCK1_9PEZI|nr:hypothetical protein QBC32DRAFT_318276 [Pseudoneurospora amorphoporcata]